MYTVLRFISPTEAVDQLMILGDRLNAIKAGMYTGIDRRGGRFSCSVSMADDWEEHLRAIEESLDVFRPVILEAQTLDIEMVFDVAIKSEDCAGKLYLSAHLTAGLMKKLSDSNVELEFTYYGAGKQP